MKAVELREPATSGLLFQLHNYEVFDQQIDSVSGIKTNSIVDYGQNNL